MLQLSQIISPYSSKGRIKVKYNLLSIKVKYNLLRERLSILHLLFYFCLSYTNVNVIRYIM